MDSRPASSVRIDEEVQYEAGLRPRTLDEYIGQDRVRENLSVAIAAARQRGEALDHVLLYGPPGLGKTTLAIVIGNELQVPIKSTAGPVLEKPGDLAAILTNLREREVLFIDEIHRMSPVIEEILYPAMEDYELDIVIGQGPGARSVKVPLQKFTLVGATTRTGLLTGPLRSRFGLVHRLDFYEEADMREIVRRSARILGVEIDGEAVNELAKRSRGTPRITNRLLRRVRDYAQVRAGGVVTGDTARSALALLEVDERGFDEIDRRLLMTIIDKFGGGPVGLGTLAAAISEEKDAIEDICEPFLMQIGFLERTPRGRVATARAYEVLRSDDSKKGLPPVVAGADPMRPEGNFLNPGQPLRRAKIISLATHVPERVLTNRDLEQLVNTTDEWILQRTGIRTRHIVREGEATSDLAEHAARKAIERAGITPGEIEFIVVGTTTPDTIFPSTACVLQNKIGARRAWGFDLGAACSGFTYALTIAAQQIAVGAHRHALAVGADVMSSIIDYTDRATCVLFGDGAGVAVLAPAEPGEPYGILDYVHEIDGSGGPALQMPAGGSRLPASHDSVEKRLHYVHQDGAAVFKFAVRKTEEICLRLLAKNGLEPHDVDLFVSHQANRRIIMSAAEKLGLASERIVINIERFGNTTGATIPLALNDAISDGRLTKGKLVMLTSVGAGFTVGAVLLRWAY